jgi:NAD(P)-dependent dehydrogenase (short-subunit alcohol dehydrogenase family)
MSYFLTKNIWETYYRLKYKLLYDPLSTITTQGNGAVAIVTGATSGIGYEVAKELTIRSYRVLIPCRNMFKGFEVAREIGSDPNDVFSLDLCDDNSIYNFAHKFLKLDIPLSLLVNNAATLEGTFEEMYQTNYEGPVLLTELLLDCLITSPNSRIVHVSSVAHSLAHPNPNDLFEDGSLMTIYANTKLYNILYSNKLNERIKSKMSGYVVTPKSAVVHPGYVSSDLYRRKDMKGILWHIGNGTWMAKSPAEGSRSILYACLSPIPFDCYMSDLHEENVGYPSEFDPKALTNFLWLKTKERLNQKKWMSPHFI